MNIDTETEKICMCKEVTQKKENVVIEKDVIVPDIKPDIMNIVNACGYICIYKKEIFDGKVRIDGGIETYVTYLTEENQIRGISTCVDFTQIINIEEVTNEMNLELETKLKDINVEILNGRKINIQANVEFEINIYCKKEEEILKEIEGIENIQKLNNIKKINALAGTGETKITAKDTIKLENERIGELLSVKTKITNKEYKISYNKILVKADFIAKIIYLTEDNNIKSIYAKLPLMGFLDIQDISEESICDINYLLKNLKISINNTEDNSLDIETEVEVQAKIYNEKEIEVISDLYSVDKEIEFKTKKIEAISQKNKMDKSMIINEKIPISDIKSQEILSIDSIPIIKNIDIMHEKIIVEGEMYVNIRYKSEETSKIEEKNIVIPFNEEINMQINGTNTKLKCEIEVIKEEINIEKEEITIEGNLQTDTWCPLNINIIKDIEIKEYERESQKSMVIYFVKPKDTLWEISKKFRTTSESICEINKIEDEQQIKVGRQLFILSSYQNKKEKIV